jgi:hypothetical protein
VFAQVGRRVIWLLGLAELSVSWWSVTRPTTTNMCWTDTGPRLLFRRGLRAGSKQPTAGCHGADVSPTLALSISEMKGRHEAVEIDCFPFVVVSDSIGVQVGTGRVAGTKYKATTCSVTTG